jgi:hypothetical protein
MTESQRLAQRGLRILADQGWPEHEAVALMNTFMEAGAALVTERLQAEAAQKESLIQRVTSGVIQ